MLEESCEDCNIPLMRSKDKKQELCVQCKRNWKDPSAKSEQINTVVNASDEKAALERLEEEKQRMLKQRLEEKRIVQP